MNFVMGTESKYIGTKDTEQDGSYGEQGKNGNAGMLSLMNTDCYLNRYIYKSVSTIPETLLCSSGTIIDSCRLKCCASVSEEHIYLEWSDIWSLQENSMWCVRGVLCKGGECLGL